MIPVKKKKIIYCASALTLFIICILFYEYKNGKITDKKNISVYQTTNITTESAESELYTTSVKNTTDITTKKAVHTTVPVTLPVTTITDVVTEVLTQAAVPQPVNEPPVPEQQDDQNNNQNQDPQPQYQEPVPEPEPVPVQGGQDAPSSSEFQREVLRLVNQYRSQAGIAEMSSTDVLNQAAQKRAEEISGVFEHVRPDGSSWSSVLDEFNIPGYTQGENIAYNYDTPENVVNGWMNSQGHRDNILNPSFTSMGVGLCINNDESYWVQLFIG